MTKKNKKTISKRTKHTSSTKQKSSKKISPQLKHKREQALLDLSAHRLVLRKQLTIPLTKITLNPKVPAVVKLVYGELYTLFNVTSKLQVNHALLAKPVGATTKQVEGALKYLAKLNLIIFRPVKPIKATHILGYIVINNGLNESANHLDKVLQDTDYRRNIMVKHWRAYGKNVMDYLNGKINRKLRYTQKVKRHVVAIFRAGYKLKDFYIVIDKMYKLWNNSDMRQYLVPSTLFRSVAKFDEYLNKPVYLSAQEKNYAENQKGGDDDFDF